MAQGLDRALIETYRDRSQNEVAREYAVQHLAELGEQAKPVASTLPTAPTANTAPVALATLDPVELGEMRQTLWEALGETDNSIAGTALLGLTLLIGQPEGVSEVYQRIVSVGTTVSASLQ